MNPDEADANSLQSPLEISSFKTPQEKKRLSYAKDHRSNYGERGRCIPKRKRSYARIARRSQNQPLDTLSTEQEDELLNTVEFRVRVAKRKNRGWKKSPDIPLGHHVAKRKRHRAEVEAAGGRRAAKRNALT